MSIALSSSSSSSSSTTQTHSAHSHQLSFLPIPPDSRSQSPSIHNHLHPPSFHRFHSHIALPQDPLSSLPSNSPLQSLRRWSPFILWIITTLGFLLAITVWRTELFRALDDLSHYLGQQDSHGQAILFLCIFATTFPPLPLYSTLIVLSGYTFGAWTGFVISYCAALSGAVVVYWISLRYLGEYTSEVLNSTGWTKQVMRAIERRPQLLFLIRVAPYPYNLMNSLLAASASLSFKTYFWCTAVSLVKLLIHTSAGSTIHEFAEYHTSEREEGEGERVARYWSVIGILLCVGIFLYLSYLARKAVREEISERADHDHEAGLIDRGMSEVTRSAR